MTTKEPTINTGLDPEFVDFKGLEQKFGVKRGHAYLLVKDKAIKAVSLRRPGQVSGKRLFVVASVREYLNSLIK